MRRPRHATATHHHNNIPSIVHSLQAELIFAQRYLAWSVSCGPCYILHRGDVRCDNSRMFSANLSFVKLKDER